MPDKDCWTTYHLKHAPLDNKIPKYQYTDTIVEVITTHRGDKTGEGRT
jgi:hypothetical protein